MTRKNEGSFEYKGQTFTWRTERGMITVSNGIHSMTTQLGNSAAAPESLARIIATEFKKPDDDD